MIERPYAWLNIAALDANIAYVNKMCGTKQIRIATKSIRSLAALKYIAARIKQFSGVMTFSASETAYIMQQTPYDCLLGYPVVDEASIVTILHERVTFMVDHEAQVALLQRLASERGVMCKVCIDLNLSTDFKALYFGTQRSSLKSEAQTTALLQYIKRCTHIVPTMVMGYEAQLAGVGSKPKNKIKGQAIRAMQRVARKKVASSRQFLVAHCKAYFSTIKEVNGGGTGSMAFTSQQKEVTEITVGSAFFAPALFDDYPLALTPAAGFALAVTRQPAVDIVVCHGGGYIASGATGVDRQPVFMDKRFTILPLEGFGEVQTPIKVKGELPKIGDTLYLRHAKAGELCERFNQLHVLKDGELQTIWSTYRGDGQCFL